MGLRPVVGRPQLGQQDGGEADSEAAGESSDVGSQDWEELASKTDELFVKQKQFISN